MQIIKADNDVLLKTAISLAVEIWREHYLSIISKEQIEYMLKKFLSFEAISEQIKNENYQFFLMQNDKGSFEGFFSFAQKDGGIFLSKIYIKKDSRGKGYAKESVSFIKDIAANLNLKNITLTVNKNNKNSIEAYKKIGFKIVDEVIAVIGNNFVMDDYKMELKI